MTYVPNRLLIWVLVVFLHVVVVVVDITDAQTLKQIYPCEVLRTICSIWGEIQK